MNCKDLKYDLALYADKALDESKMALVKEHLQRCPVCRQELSELNELRLELRRLKSPSAPASFVLQVRRNVILELQAPTKKYGELNRWLQFRVMPYFVGITLSVLTFTLFLASLFSTNTVKKSDLTLAHNETSNSNRSKASLAAEYASLRTSVASESPSINPEGSLVNFSRFFVNHRFNQREMVIVADVFSNGMAKIFEVIQPTQDKEIIEALQKALEETSDETAFLPANFDKRSDVVRVVLKIQGVEVTDKVPRQKLSTKRRI